MMVGGMPVASVVFHPPAFGLGGSLLIAASVAAAVLAYATGLRWRQSTRPGRFVLLGLRLAAILCLLATILHPAWISTRSTLEKPIMAVLLDDSASMGLETESPGPAAAQERFHTRYGEAVRALSEHVLPALAERHRVRLYDVEARTLNADDLPATPSGDRSPLTQTLLRVQRELRAEPLVGIALLSDGVEVATEPALGGLDQLHTPVHAIEVAGTPGEAPVTADLAIRAVSANRRALVGNTVRVVVDLAAAGRVDDVQVPLTVWEGDTLRASRSIRWELRDRARRAELEFVPQRPGRFTYTVSVGALPGETDLGNNRQTFPLDVRAQPLTVMYIDGVLRWEGKFIRAALAADPDINLISTVRTTPPGSDHGAQGLLLPQQLADVDVVILGDVEATYFSTSDELPALRAWVNAGGGLVLTGGYRSFGPAGFGRTELRDVLPIEFSSAANPQYEQPFNLKLTDAGREHPIFQLSGDRARDTAFFNRLPPLDGCTRVAGVKPAAEVLAVNPRIAGPDGTRGLPIMVAQQVGNGRSLVFAVDTTWRWRLVVGGFTGDSSFYERFWGQLVRWMASDQTQTSPTLFVATQRTRYRLGETIELNIRLPAEGAAAAGGWEVSAAALDEGGRQTPVPLAELGDGNYRGRLAARRPGRLDITVTAEPRRNAAASEGNARADKPPVAPDAAPERQRARVAQSRVVTLEVERPDVELLNPLPDRQWLAQVAQRTGGRLVQPDQIDTWARQLPAERVPTTVRRTSGTWGDWIFGGAFLVFLCAEWILRRRSQMA